MGNISFQHRKRPIFDELSRRRLVDLRVQQLSPSRNGLQELDNNRASPWRPKHRANQLPIRRASPQPCPLAASQAEQSPSATRRPLTFQTHQKRFFFPTNRANHSATPTRPIINPSSRIVPPGLYDRSDHLNRARHSKSPTYFQQRHFPKTEHSSSFDDRVPQQRGRPLKSRYVHDASPPFPSRYSLIDITEPTLNVEKYPNRDEIIRKIRNFNDFINAVKKELNEKRSNEDSVRIKMHIENQAFDIDKYRNLFEKEVARKYGISTINVSEDRNQPVKYLDLQMAHPRQRSTQQTTDASSLSKEESLTNRRTSVGSAMKSSMMAKESIIAKGKNELEERLRQTMEQLKHISELLYDESEPVKSKQITTNITKINEIIDSKTQVTSVAELNPRGQAHVEEARKCFRHLEELVVEQKQDIQTARTFLQQIEATDEDSEC